MKQNELAQPTFVDQSVDEVKDFREKLKFMFENGVLPKSYLDIKVNEKDKECTQISEESLNKAMAVISYGKALGLSPEMALTHCMNVNGHMSIYVDAINAIIYSSGLLKKAGLWGKGVWKQYPKRMAQMRARGFAYRDVFPDLLHGLITTEEAYDMPTTATGSYSDVVAVAKVRKTVTAEEVKRPAIPQKIETAMTVEDICGGLKGIQSEKDLGKYYIQIKNRIEPENAQAVVKMFADRKAELKELETENKEENTETETGVIETVSETVTE